jgi:tetratricopeptide (TPR) repeat protein
MFALLISLIIGLAISWTCIASGIKSGQIAYGILGFIASQVLISVLIRKKFGKLNDELQELLAAGQKRVQHKINQFQMKPGGNPRLIQQQVERDQQALFKTALEFTDKFGAFRKWNVLMDKQISTLRLQFLYQLKEFEQVDELLSRSILTGPVLSDPLLVGMKMARQYKNKNVRGAEKTFKRYIRWFRNDRGAMLYGVMTWICVKEGRVEEALQLLTRAKEKMYNEVIIRNWEALANNRPRSFSNAGFGDPWYGLYLENPPAPKRQQVRVNQKGRRPF